MSFSPQQIVVPLDFSKASPMTAAAGRDLLDKFAGGDLSRLHFIHVVPPLETISPGAIWGGITDDTRREAVMEHASEFFAKHGLEGASIDVRVGQPAHEICEFANELKADLIVISTHGYHGMKRVLLGSVAESVIRHAACDIVVCGVPMQSDRPIPIGGS